MRRLPDCRAAGFTLVEAMITIAVLALAMGVVLVNWGSSKAELRAASAKLAGTIRASYDGAALSGQTYRLVFGFEKSEIRVEATDQVLAFSDGENPLVRGARTASVSGGGLDAMIGTFMRSEFASDADDDEQELDEPPPALQALIGLADRSNHAQAASFSGIGHDLTLEDGVHLLDVWVQGMGEPASEGEVYLYFWAHGYTQDAVINLEDDQARVFGVKVQALTGKTEIVAEYVEALK